MENTIGAPRLHAAVVVHERGLEALIHLGEGCLAPQAYLKRSFVNHWSHFLSDWGDGAAQTQRLGSERSVTWAMATGISRAHGSW